MIRIYSRDRLLIVLEPGNIRRIMAGEPMKVEVSPELTIGIAYTPDVEWVQEQYHAHGTRHTDDIAEILERSLTRPPIDRGRKIKGDDYAKGGNNH